MRKLGSSEQCLISNTNTVMNLIPWLQSTENTDGVLWRWLINHNLLKSTLEGLVLLNVLAVLVVRRGTDASDLTTGQSRLQQIRSIHRTTGGAGTDHSVHLINEENNFALALGHLLQNALESLLEFATHSRTGDQCTEIKADQAARGLHAIGNVSIDHSLGNALGNRSLTYARIADENRIVFRTTRQDLNGTTDLIITTYHRILHA